MNLPFEKTESLLENLLAPAKKTRIKDFGGVKPTVLGKGKVHC